MVALDPGARIRFLSGARGLLGRMTLARGAMIHVTGQGLLEIGDGFFLGRNSTVCCETSIRVGRNVLIAERTSLYDHDHVFARTDIPFSHQGLKAAPIRIGNNVWIGAGCFIAKGVTIGDNVVVGAGTVVTRDIPANCIAHGGGGLVIRARPLPTPPPVQG